MKFLLNGEGVWTLVNPPQQGPTIQDGLSTGAGAGPSRTQGARTRTTRSPPPPPLTQDKLGTRKATYLIYQSCTATPQFIYCTWG